MMGKVLEYEMLAVSTDATLEKNDLIFLSEPVSDYDTTYDYRVSRILPSLNNNQYLLEGMIP